jgi:hypothetical protein
MNFEVIELNIKTGERRTHSFDNYYKVTGFLKSREDKVKRGYTYTVVELTSLLKFNGGNK